MEKVALGRIPGWGGNRGPGRPGRRMAAKLFEIEMQRTCTNVTKTNSYICQLFFADSKSRTIPNGKNVERRFHSQCRLARVSLSLCIFGINISFQSSG